MLVRENKGQTVKIIDFENLDNNEFLCTNQFKVSGVNQNIIPDIVLFVNGLLWQSSNVNHLTSLILWRQG